ncbi:PKD domain-containing protein [Vicingaceae bacterium]|nr:PKD domain-containing protein [Vicingaceae bacterium]
MKHLNKIFTLLSLITIIGINNVDAQCVASFSYIDNGNGDISFTSTGTGGTWNWNFGDGNTSLQTNPSHTFNLNGTYWVQLEVSDSNCFDSTSQQIVVTSAIPCNLNTSFTYVDNGNGVYDFTATVTGGSGPYTYLWDFIGGSNSTISNPTVAYSTSGIYNPCLTVTDVNGCTSTYCDSIQVNSAPCNISAGFSYSDNGSGNYSFTNTSSSNVNSHYWNFGDGSSAPQWSPNHTYTANGIYVVELIVVDSSGFCSDYFIQTIQVSGVSNPTMCNAAFVIYPDSSNNGSVIVFNTSTGNNLSYFWQFGDGNTSSQQFPNYNYTTSGPFELCLTVTDSVLGGGSCTSTYCDSIISTGVVFKTGGFNINVQGPVITSIKNENEPISLLNVYPNPFKNNITVEFNLTEQTQTEIYVTDLIGNRISEIINTSLNSGNNSFNWTAKNIANGVYLLNIKTENFIQVKKLILNR